MAKRATKTETFVRDWCLEAEMLVEDLDPSVRKLMNLYTWYLQCIPGCETRKAKVSTSFNIWNWRKAAIRFSEDPQRFNLFLTVLLYKGLLSPNMMSSQDLWSNLDEEVYAAGSELLGRLLTHQHIVTTDFMTRASFDPMDYDQTDMLTHWIVLNVLQQLTGLDLSREIEELAECVLEKWRAFFPNAVLLQRALTKDNHGTEEVASRIIDEMFDHAFGYYTEGCTGPAGLRVR